MFLVHLQQPIACARAQKAKKSKESKYKKAKTENDEKAEAKSEKRKARDRRYTTWLTQSEYAPQERISQVAARYLPHISPRAR